MAQSWDVLPFLVRPEISVKIFRLFLIGTGIFTDTKIFCRSSKSEKKVISHRLFVFAGNFPS